MPLFGAWRLLKKQLFVLAMCHSSATKFSTVFGSAMVHTNGNLHSASACHNTLRSREADLWREPFKLVNPIVQNAQGAYDEERCLNSHAQIRNKCDCLNGL